MAFKVIDGLSNGDHGQPRRERHGRVEVLDARHQPVLFTLTAANNGIAFTAISKYSPLLSKPMLRNPQAVAAAIVEPEPIKGSRMEPSSNGREARTICRMK